MKKFFAVILTVCLSYSSDVFAFLIPPLPPSPSLDFIDDALDVGKGIMKFGRNVSDEIRQVKEELLNQIAATIASLIPFDLNESPLKKIDGESVIAAAKTIKNSSIADIKDKPSVANAYKQLFLTLPEGMIASVPAEQRSAVINLFKKKGEEFIADSQMENYMAANSLRTERLPLIEKENQSMEECMVDGKENMSAICQGASSTEEELGNWSNHYKIRETQDKLIRMQEELVLIDAQYEAAKTLKTGVKPLNNDVLIKGVQKDAN